MTDKKARPSTSEEYTLIGEIQDAGEKMLNAYQKLVAMAGQQYSPRLVVKLSPEGFTTESCSDGVFVDISNIAFHPATVIKPFGAGK